jgi:methionine-rich copper-binding protein CopC
MSRGFQADLSCRRARILSRIRARLPRLVSVPLAVVLGGALVALVPALPANAACANPIACENALTGTPQSVWDVTSPSSSIVGFADPFSVNAGGSIGFKIRTPASSYAIDIYRMGYYGGDGARLITSLNPDIAVSQSQPDCSSDTTTGLVDCGNWGVSATWSVPADAVSGVYFARISRTDGTSGANQIPFVVTNNASHSDAVMMTSDETWQAYNDWGGSSLYVGSNTGHPWCCTALDPGRAVQVSYNRPFATRYDTPGGQDFFFATEYPLVRFLERNGYDVSYVSQVDVAQPGAAAMLEQHKVFINSGHSEYWDAGDRAAVTAARDAGVNVAFFTGNTMWWKTRWAASHFGNEPYRTLITYKESLDSVQSDPADPPTWTGEWRDPRFSPPGDGGQPENALTGQLWEVNCCSYADQVPSDYAKLRFWRDTPVASLSSGSYSLPNETLGYEWDSDIDNGSRPPGEIDMSKTCEAVSQKLLDIREDVGPGNACNSLTLYRAASGALVFDAGTVQWDWGLDADHDGDVVPTSPAMQQATVNLLADMGAQPATLQSGLAQATQSTDHTPPSSTITSPSAGATVSNGGTVTITGTATDSGGGVVAGVEVSTDGGTTWHPVTTMSAADTSVTWSYTWSVAGSGTVTIKSRATDDSGNTETPGPGVQVTVNCPCSMFGSNYTPAATSVNDSAAYELGMKFSSTVPGWVSGVRFYKGAGNTGTHTGSLWTASGTLLATGTFMNETASGWQSMTFANAVQISANTTYVVSYYDPNGHYADDQDLFDTALNTPPLTALKSVYTDPGGGNGVFNAGGPGFPTGSFNGSSYGVDVIFDTSAPSTPPVVTGVTPADGSTGNALSVTPTATFSQAVVPGTVSFTLKDAGGNSVPGSVSLNGDHTVATFTPSSPLAAGTTYTATVSGAQNSSGTPMTGPFSWSFATGGAVQCPCSIWDNAPPQGASDAADTSALNLGVQFQASTDGAITGVRFYKEADNTGTHVGSLWSATGALLATGTFTGESASGWQELDFSSPVPVTAGTTYVASYHTDTGHYAFTSAGLSSPVTNGPLTALASGGVYAYGSGNAFPSASFNSANYWVDVVYSPNSGSTPPAVTDSTPGAGSSGNLASAAPTATFSEAVKPGTVSFTLKDSGGNSVPGTVSFNGNNTVATFTPSSSLAADTTYTATVSGAQNSSGTPMTSPFSWSFSTAGTQCPCSIWPNSATPSVASANDPSAVNLGVKFIADADGWIAGIRFYKGAGNTGTHVGSLWSASGTLLGQVTFTNETASGWQEADFAAPVHVTAGTTYVASYFAPNGGYAYNSGAFASSGVDNPPLHALSSPASGGDGVYVYGSTPAFPSSTFNGTNYWVDVVFTEP